MIELIPIKVECYSGYKADEYPKCFYWDKNRFEVQQVLDRWYQGDSNPEWPVSNYFKVATECGELFILKHDLVSDKCHLCR